MQSGTCAKKVIRVCRWLGMRKGPGLNAHWLPFPKGLIAFCRTLVSEKETTRMHFQFVSYTDTEEVATASLYQLQESGGGFNFAAI